MTFELPIKNPVRSEKINVGATTNHNIPSKANTTPVNKILLSSREAMILPINKPNKIVAKELMLLKRAICSPVALKADGSAKNMPVNTAMEFLPKFINTNEIINQIYVFLTFGGRFENLGTIYSEILLFLSSTLAMVL